MSSSKPLSVLAVSIVALASCRYGPSRVEQPGIDPSSAGRLAMKQYDANGDGRVAGDELEKAPALMAALPRLDTNNDGGVSADEVAARVKVWKGMRIALASIRCHVTLDGQPLTDATVVFEPETFLGDEIKPASGTTDSYGDVAPTIAREDLPDPKLPGGMHLGFYRVRITKQLKGRETVPARYNKDSILGQEVSYDEPAIASRSLVYALKSSG